MSDSPEDLFYEQMYEAIESRSVADADACFKAAIADPDSSSFCELGLHMIAGVDWIPGLEVAHRYCKNLDVRGYDGTTPLECAVSEIDVEVARWLLDHGANASLVNARGVSVLAGAAALKRWGEPELYELLLSRGTSHDIYSIIELGELGPVREFLKENPQAVRQHPRRDGLVSSAIRALTRRTTRPDKRELDDRSLAELRELLALLIRHGADVNGRDDGQTALHHVASSNVTDPRVVELLLDSGAEVNLPCLGDGSTPLDSALVVVAPFADLLKRRGGRTTRPVVDMQQELWRHMPMIREAVDRQRDADGPDSSSPGATD